MFFFSSSFFSSFVLRMVWAEDVKGTKELDFILLLFFFFQAVMWLGFRT